MSASYWTLVVSQIDCHFLPNRITCARDDRLLWEEQMTLTFDIYNFIQLRQILIIKTMSAKIIMIGKSFDFLSILNAVDLGVSRLYCLVKWFIVIFTQLIFNIQTLLSGK